MKRIKGPVRKGLESGWQNALMNIHSLPTSASSNHPAPIPVEAAYVAGSLIGNKAASQNLVLISPHAPCTMLKAGQSRGARLHMLSMADIKTMDVLVIPCCSAFAYLNALREFEQALTCVQAGKE